jgi:hypothetical protein
VRDTVRGHGEKAAMELMGASPPENSADRQMFGDNFDAGGWKILCPVSCVPRLRLLKSVRLPPCNPVLPLCILQSGTAVIMDYNIWHRGCRRMPGGLWRAMFKLQFFRTSAPGPTPSWDHVASPTDIAPFAHTGGSRAQQEIWSAMWRWLRGSPMPTPAELEDRSNDAHVSTILSSRKELDRVGAGYALGKQAAGGDHTALAALIELLQTAHDNGRRAAMYGLAASGDAAVPQLASVITSLIGGSEQVDIHTQNVVVSAMLALGEASITPTPAAM